MEWMLFQCPVSDQRTVNGATGSSANRACTIARDMTLETLTIVGVGLIGGSVGLAARERRLAPRVIGVGRSHAGLDHARERGAIDFGTCDLTEAARQSDFLLF